MAVSAHCYDHCQGPLPVPAGKSAFRIKGEFYRHLDQTITTVDGRSGGALLKAFKRDGIDAFQRQPFVSTAYYDNLPLPRMVMCLAEVMGKDVTALTTKMGAKAGEAQLKSKYAELIAGLSPQTFGEEFTKIIAFFYDYGPVAVTVGKDSKSLRVVRAGMPLAVTEWWSLVSIPFLRVPLEKNGAKDVDVKWATTITDARAQVPLGTVTWDVRWL
jgi:hypothetical protein